MSTRFILTTRTSDLMDDWRRQLPGVEFPSENEAQTRRELSQTGARVWICDAADERSRWGCHPDTVRVLVGQTHSLPFAQMRAEKAALFFLSYEESRVRLADVLTAAATLAEKNAALQTLLQRPSRGPWEIGGAGGTEVGPGGESLDEWSFVENALVHLEDRELLLADFLRTARTRVGVLRCVLFLRAGDEYRSASGEALMACPVSSPLVLWLEERVAVVDLDRWQGTDDLRAEAEIRRSMTSWRVRMLVPLMGSGPLIGWLGLGARADGSPHNNGSRGRALAMARLLEAAIERHEAIVALRRTENEHRQYLQYLTSGRIVDPRTVGNDEIPTEIRALVGEVAHRKEAMVVEPTAGSPLRILAGPVAGGDQVWVSWMDCTATVGAAKKATDHALLSLLTEFAQVVQHELGNSLTVAATVHELLAEGRNLPPNIVARLGQDLQRLGEMKRLLGYLNSMPVAPDEVFDTRLLADELRARLGVRVVAPDPTPNTLGSFQVITDCVTAIVRAAMKPQSTDAAAGITIEFARRGAGAEELALVVVRGVTLPPAGLTGGLAKHAELGVYVARELLNRHGATLRIDQGMRGAEIHLVLVGAAGRPVKRPPVQIPQSGVAG